MSDQIVEQNLSESLHERALKTDTNMPNIYLFPQQKTEVTVPCSRTPPFFLKRGLPDHNGGLEERDKEIKKTLVNHSITLQQTGRPSGFHGEQGSETGI